MLKLTKDRLNSKTTSESLQLTRMKKFTRLNLPEVLVVVRGGNQDIADMDRQNLETSGGFDSEG